MMNGKIRYMFVECGYSISRIMRELEIDLPTVAKALNAEYLLRNPPFKPALRLPRGTNNKVAAGYSNWERAISHAESKTCSA